MTCWHSVPQLVSTPHCKCAVRVAFELLMMAYRYKKKVTHKNAYRQKQQNWKGAGHFYRIIWCQGAYFTNTYSIDRDAPQKRITQGWFFINKQYVLANSLHRAIEIDTVFSEAAPAHIIGGTPWLWISLPTLKEKLSPCSGVLNRLQQDINKNSSQEK